MDRKYDLIVIGAGPAGLSAARFSRMLKPDWKILVIRKQKHSVIPCALPYALDGTIKTDDYIKSDEKLLKNANIGLVLDDVVEISSQSKSLTTRKSGEFSYEKLVLATGSVPFVPPIPGVDLKNVFTIKDHPDILSILEVLGQVKKAVVVGAGFIGLEMVNAFYNRGIEVALVEKEKACLPNSLSADFAHDVQADLEEHGVKLFLGRLLKEIRGEGVAQECILDDGTVLGTDIVVLSVGVQPNVSLAKQAGIRTEPTGILVDEYFKTSVPDIYAVGDCIQTRSAITGEVISGFLATNAVVGARFAAVNITGGRRAFGGVINPVVTRIFDYSCGTVGFTKDALKKAKIDFLYADTEVHNHEKAFPGAVPLKMRLIFKKDNLELIGAEVISKENVSWIVNMLSLAVLNKNSADDIAFMQYCGHPPQIDVPAKMPLVLCAIEVLKQAGKLL